MTHNPGPWDLPEPPPTPRQQRRTRWAWPVFVLALIALVLALARAFPEALRNQQDWFQVALQGGFVLLIAAGLVRLRGASWRQHLGHVAVWSLIVAVLALGFAYRDELAGVPLHLQRAFSMGEPVAAGRDLSITAQEGGAFELVGKVNGGRVRFMVDTGASETVLSPDDAKRLGIDLKSLKFDSPAGTANGVVYGARYVVDRLEIGPIVLTKFPVVINPQPMGISLLGMTFLSRMQSVELRGHTLTLRAP